MKTQIDFINHASVIIKGEHVSILTDPWFNGGAFNNGWKLLSETTDLVTEKILKKISHIWISRENQDHFSSPFFKKFSQCIIKDNIKILFQETEGNRIINFFKGAKIMITHFLEGSMLLRNYIMNF